MVATATLDNLFLWLSTIAGFAILIWLFAGKKFGAERRTILQTINRMLDARAARIDAQLRVAEESRAEAVKGRQEAEAEIVRARDEAAAIVSRAHGMLGSIRAEMVSDAEREKNRIVEQAREEIEAEQNRAILTLRAQAADLAVDAAREVLHRSMDESADHAIIMRALTEDAPNGASHA